MEIENLVISGGGIHGMSYIGALKYLEEQEMLIKIKKYCGTSIGSIICFLLNIKFTMDEVVEIVVNNTLFDKKDMKIQQLITKYGLDDGNRLMKVIKVAMNKKKINEDITFIELSEQTQQTLTVVGCNLTKKTIEYFDKETSPNVKVREALMLSCSVPLLYTPYIMNENVYVDGALLNNFPMNVFEKDTNVLGIKSKVTYVQEKGFLSYFMNMLNLVKDNIEMNQSTKHARIVEIDNQNIPTFTYEYKRHITELLKNGYNTMKSEIN